MKKVTISFLFSFLIIAFIFSVQAFAEEAADPEVLVSDTFYEEEIVDVAVTGEVTEKEDTADPAPAEEDAEPSDRKENEDPLTEPIAEVFSDEATESLDEYFDITTLITLSRDLQYGSTGDDVRSIQERLAELGYNTGTIDGVFGPVTMAAVLEFQRDRGLYVDGVVGKLSLAELNSAALAPETEDHATASLVLPALSRYLIVGTNGTDVLALQQALLRLGYKAGTADGEFGPVTQAAVYAFQRDHGLYVDGEVGSQTWGTLTTLTGSKQIPGSEVASQQDSTDSAAMASLTLTRALSYGTSGNDVVRLQEALARLGYNVGPADGGFGNMTHNAVLAFQRDHKLHVDGEVGKITIASLNEALRLLSGSADVPGSASGDTPGNVPGSVPGDSASNVANATDLDTENGVAPTRNSDVGPVPKELSYGMTGDDVKEVQRQLISLGYLSSGLDDGIFGTVTEKAVKEFQRANGSVDPSGIVDEWFTNKMNGSPIAQSEVLYNKVIPTSQGDYNFTRNMEYEMEGDDIALVQERLIAQGYLAAEAKGYFGNMTREAILAYQRDMGQIISGMIDESILDLLFTRTFPSNIPVNETYTASSLVDSVHITDKNYDREDYEIKYIIPHHMAGRLSGEDCAIYFVNNGLENSANYCIGFNGDIALGVPEDYGAWTSSWWAADEQGITIEVSDTTISDNTIPQRAQDALVNLCVDLIQRYPSLGGQMVYDESDKDIVIAARKARDPSMLSQVKGNVLLHNWTSGGVKDCPGQGMLDVLPDIVNRVNEKLKNQES